MLVERYLNQKTAWSVDLEGIQRYRCGDRSLFGQRIDVLGSELDEKRELGISVTVCQLEVKSVLRLDLLGLENCSKRKGQQEVRWKAREAGLCDPCAEDVQQAFAKSG